MNCTNYTFRGYFGFGPDSQRQFDANPYGGMSNTSPRRNIRCELAKRFFRGSSTLRHIGTAYAALRKARRGPARRSCQRSRRHSWSRRHTDGAWSRLARILGTARDRKRLARVKALAPEPEWIEVVAQGEGRSVAEWARSFTGGHGVDAVQSIASALDVRHGRRQMMKKNDSHAAEALFPSGHQPPSDYQRPPQYDRIVCDKDVAVRDARRRHGRGRRLSAGRAGQISRIVCLRCSFQGAARQRASEGFSAAALLVIAVARPRGGGRYRVLRVARLRARDRSPRGFLKSGDGGSREWDSYDVIEWIAKQPWCDGNIGMIGIGAFASEQFHAARQQPPLLKAIFPYDPRGAYGKFGGFREEYPGGVLHAFRYLMDHFSSVHTARGAPGELPPEQGGEMARSNRGPRYPHVSASAQRAGAEGPAHAALFRCADRSLRQ